MSAPLTLRLRGLLAIYVVIPLCALAFALDREMWGGALHDALPRNPDQLLLYGLLFGWPHIIASNVLLVTNREYRQVYARRVVIAALVIIAFFGIGNYVLPYIVLSVVAATATIIHVLKQQIGIGGGAARLRGWIYPAWGWAGILTGVFLYNTLYLEDDLMKYAWILEDASLVLAGAVVVLALVCHAKIESTLGRVFLWSNTAMVLAPVAFHRHGYDVFALAIPRVIHDTTAFTFYVAHDHNKHAGAAGPRNLLYRAAARLPGGVYWLSPALAVGLGFVIEHYPPETVSLAVLGFLAMLHYYTESFTWKQGSPYRQWIAMRA